MSGRAAGSARVQDEDGAAALTTLLAVVLSAAIAAGTIVAVADLSVTAARGRAAADAAALAGMATSPLLGGGTPLLPAADPDRAARQVAAANGATVRRVDRRGWPLRYHVTVEVMPQTSWVRQVVGAIAAQATAAVRPRVPQRPARATSGRERVENRATVEIQL